MASGDGVVLGDVSTFAGLGYIRLVSSRSSPDDVVPGWNYLDFRRTTLYSGGAVFRRCRPDFRRVALYLGSIVLRRSDDVVFGRYRPDFYGMAL